MKELTILLEGEELGLECITGEKDFYPWYRIETSIKDGKEMVIDFLIENYHKNLTDYGHQDVDMTEQDEFIEMQRRISNSISKFVSEVSDCYIMDEDSNIKSVSTSYNGDFEEGQYRISVTLKKIVNLRVEI